MARPSAERDPQVKTVGGLYCLGRKLGSGSFGDIYFAVNMQTGQEVAVKLESTKSKHAQLMYEAKLLKHLQGGIGIAHVYYCDVEGDCNAMVMDLLGPSLEDLFNMCKRKFSLKTVFMVADQLLHRIEYLHYMNFLHRDIKPDNFLISPGGTNATIYMIDLGLAKKFRDSKTKAHIPYREDKALTGTARYASVNTHIGIEQSRRDDLQAIGYVLMYFNRGKLPWQGLNANTKEEKYKKIMECKRATSTEELCKGYPPAFSSYLNYVCALRFEDRPDYSYLQRVLKEAFLSLGFTDDGVFDWSQPLADRRAKHALANDEYNGHGIGKQPQARQKREVEHVVSAPDSTKAFERSQHKSHPRSRTNGTNGDSLVNDGQRSRGPKLSSSPEGFRHSCGTSIVTLPSAAAEPAPTPASSAKVSQKKVGFLASLFKCGSTNAKN